MKLTTIIEAITPDLQKSFDTIFTKIHGQIKSETGIDITPKWLSGVMNQYNNFAGLNSALKNYSNSNTNLRMQQGAEYKANVVNDIKARIIARNVLSNYGLFDKNNRYLPKKKMILSNMRQYYSDEARAAKDEFDVAKRTREAASDEYTEWYNSLPDDQKNMVTQLQELNSNEVAGFRGILQAKQHKKEFVTRLYQLSTSSPMATNLLQKMGLVTHENKISTTHVEKLRAFLNGLTDARLKDVLSKEAVYTGKSIAHTTARANNKVLKDIEHNPQGKSSLMIKLYKYISTKIAKYEDKERAFRRMLDKIPLAHGPTGEPSEIGKGAYHLYKKYKGKSIDVNAAIKELNALYTNPADGAHRADKAEGRGEQIRQIGDI